GDGHTPDARLAGWRKDGLSDRASNSLGIHRTSDWSAREQSQSERTRSKFWNAGVQGILGEYREDMKVGNRPGTYDCCRSCGREANSPPWQRGNSEFVVGKIPK